MADLPELLGGRYEVGEKLGSGGMAVVMAGRDRALGRRVAIKALFPHLAADPAFATRFRREAQSAARLSHPNVVAVFDVGSQDSGRPDEVDFIVMELVDGRTLRQIVEQDGPLPPARAATIARDMCAALEAAHQNGLVHRDVKPANVMITKAGEVKVMDFGIARAGDADRITQTGLAIGTAQYASPEQLHGRDVDGRSDVYSVGCCLYEMLTGSPPFTGSTAVSVAYRQVSEAPVPLRQRDPAIPAGLEAVVARTLAKDRDDRYASAAALGRDLARVLTGAPPTAPLLTEVTGSEATLGATARSAAGRLGVGRLGSGRSGTGRSGSTPTATVALGAGAGTGSPPPVPGGSGNPASTTSAALAGAEEQPPGPDATGTQPTGTPPAGTPPAGPPPAGPPPAGPSPAGGASPWAARRRVLVAAALAAICLIGAATMATMRLTGGSHSPATVTTSTEAPVTASPTTQLQASSTPDVPTYTVPTGGQPTRRHTTWTPPPPVTSAAPTVTSAAPSSTAVATTAPAPPVTTAAPTASATATASTGPSGGTPSGSSTPGAAVNPG